jgi:hypothetical protein
VLFSELHEEYGDKPPKSDEFLRAFLLKRGFVQSVVDTPIRTYRDTMELVEQAKQTLEFKEMDEFLGTADAAENAEGSDVNIISAAQPTEVALAGRPPSAFVAPSSPDELDDTYRLSDGRAFVLRWPASMTADEYEDFEAWITLLQRKLKRSIQQ